MGVMEFSSIIDGSEHVYLIHFGSNGISTSGAGISFVSDYAGEVAFGKVLLLWLQVKRY